jgi:hypothetical protein
MDREAGQHDSFYCGVGHFGTELIYDTRSFKPPFNSGLLEISPGIPILRGRQSR